MTFHNACTIRSVQPSQTVQAFDPLCEVQSDKASVELTSPYPGLVKKIFVQEGEVARVGEDLCLIEVSEEDADPDAQQEFSDQAASDMSTRQIAQNEMEPLEEEISIPAADNAEPDRVRQLHPLDPRAQQEQVRPGGGKFTALTSADSDAEVLALPSVRHFAKSVGIGLGQVGPGSGKGGRVEKKDVEAHLARSSGKGGDAAEGMSAKEEEAVIELSRTRYAMWKAMEKVRLLFYWSLHTELTGLQSLEIPHFG